MEELERFFEINRVIVYSAYGQAFFTMGLAVLLQSRRYSRLVLARYIWLLGAFGITHGLSEWAFVFNPVQAQYLSESIVSTLWLAQALVEAVSFALLFQFGAELIVPAVRWQWVRLVPTVVFLVWCFVLYVSTYYSIGYAGRADEVLFRSGDIWARYLLALPGSVAVAVGLSLQTRAVDDMGLPPISRYTCLASGSFIVYALLAGLLVPPAEFFPANAINRGLLRSTLGVPVPVFRSFCGLAIAYFTVRALSVFDVEMDRMIDRMERERMIARERERIGRELHDGTIQSLYAAGLALEDATYTLGEDPQASREKIRKVMGSLNQTIDEIRRYILDLRSAVENREFEEQLRGLARDFAEQAGLSAEVRVIPDWRRPLSPDQSAHLLQVAREVFANAARHARATRIEVTLRYGRDAIRLEVADDGRGIDPRLMAKAHARGRGQGLRNVAHRIESLGGTVMIQTATGGGTRVMAEVPYNRSEPA